jgi:hypothetical protein
MRVASPPLASPWFSKIQTAQCGRRKLRRSGSRQTDLQPNEPTSLCWLRRSSGNCVPVRQRAEETRPGREIQASASRRLDIQYRGGQMIRRRAGSNFPSGAPGHRISPTGLDHVRSGTLSMNPPVGTSGEPDRGKPPLAPSVREGWSPQVGGLEPPQHRIAPTFLLSWPLENGL